MTKRQPSGTPVGGQFAVDRKPEGAELSEKPAITVKVRDLDPDDAIWYSPEGSDMYDEFEGGWIDVREIDGATLISSDDDTGDALLQLKDGSRVKVQSIDLDFD